MKIFYDVDTQYDFMKEEGRLYVPGAESIIDNVGMLTMFAVKNSIPIIGSMDRHFGTEEYKHREEEFKAHGGPFPYHCMDRSLGQKKIGMRF